ncbi:MAG TPA: 3D domain-containing protein [Gaiellaceae bacterium]|jgi:3D (Asp-Asp-Asp) domain-containing protein
MHGPARYLAPCVAALLLGSTTGPADGARPPDARLAALETAKRSAVLELYALESSLAWARASVAENARRGRALSLAHDRALARAAVVRRSLASTQRRIATLLRRLYVEGAPEPVAVLFGARSLPAVLEGLDGLERATRLNRDLATEARRRAAALQLGLRRLARARTALASTRIASEQALAGLEAVASEKRATIASLARSESLTLARVRALEARAEEAERRSRRLVPRATQPSHRRFATHFSPNETSRETADVPQSTDDAPLPVYAPSGTRALVVDTVAYHLRGRTASGLPVGIGVIAVDPSVIPLGTRVFVPGYGPAVAADVGSAIRGNIVDLWMPSTAAARAWGRRTVTITVYG